jgi:hypothetical protein
LQDCFGKTGVYANNLCTSGLTLGVMVCGAIHFGSRSLLVFIQGSLNAARYINEVLEPVLLPYLQGHRNCVFQQDKLSLMEHVDTLAKLRVQIQRAWDEIPQAEIDYLILIMPRRLNECIRLRGDTTHYYFLTS